MEIIDQLQQEIHELRWQMREVACAMGAGAPDTVLIWMYEKRMEQFVDMIVFRVKPAVAELEARVRGEAE